MKTQEFLSKVTLSHEELVCTVSLLNQEQLCRVNTCGDWSVKEILGHITWYEKEMVGLLSKRALHGSSLWDFPLDQRNEKIRGLVKGLSLTKILSEFDLVYKSLIYLILELKDEELSDPKYFDDMPSDWIPWEVIASNTYEHYSAHAGDIRNSFKLT